VKASKVRDPGRALALAFALLLAAAVAFGAGYFLRPQDTARAVSFPGEAMAVSTIRGVVQSAGPDSITVQTEAGPVTLKLTPSTPVEALRRVDLSQVRPGDWVNAGGVHHNQTVYALTGLVVIPAANLQAPR
jgi:hypothetical protein